MKNKFKIQFANAAVGKAEACVGFTNEISIGKDGWAQIAPFGDFPSFAVIPQPDGSCKRLQAIQRIDKKCAGQMVAEFQNSRKGVKKFFSGRPIYVGHPDVPGIGAKYPDKSAKGVIADLAVREDGLYGMPVFTNEGSDLVEKKKLRFFSGRLTDCEEGDAVNGVPVFTPTVFLSVGLTNQPHLPVQMLNEADEAETNNNKKNENAMKKKLIALLAALSLKPSFANAEAPTNEETEAALDQINQKVVAFANEKQTLADKVTALETEKTKLAGDLTAAQTATTTAQTSFANERKAHVKTVLDAAVTAGKITGADRATWETRLGNEATFANEVTALEAIKPVVKTKSITIDRGNRKIELANAADRREMLAELVNEEMKGGVSYDIAFAKVQKQFPQIFEAMEQPETHKKRK